MALYTCYLNSLFISLPFFTKQHWMTTFYLQLFRQRLSRKLKVKKCTRQCRLALWVVRVWLCLIEAQAVIQQQGTRKNEYVFGLFPSTTLRNTLRFTQATVKTTITHNNVRHCRVSFSPFVRQPFTNSWFQRTPTVKFHFRNLTLSHILFSKIDPWQWQTNRINIISCELSVNRRCSSVSLLFKLPLIVWTVSVCRLQFWPPVCSVLLWIVDF